MRKLVELLVEIVLALTIVGFIPAIMTVLVMKYDLLAMLVGAFVVASILYEISKM